MKILEPRARILISTQYEVGKREGSPGSSMPLIVIGEFLADIFGLDVEIFDPIFQTQRFSKSYKIRFVDNIVLERYDLIVNPQFFMMKKKFCGFDIVEPTATLTKLIEPFISEWLPLMVPFGSKKLNSKTYFSELSIPYVYYLDWLVRWGFKSSLFERLEFKNECETRKIRCAIHLRPRHWKSIGESLTGKKYEDFIIRLCTFLRIDHGWEVYVYGNEATESKVYRKAIELGCIDLEKKYPDPMRKAIFLKNINIFFSGVNGYTSFASYLSWSSNNFIAHYIINDRQRHDPALFLEKPRRLSMLVPENNILVNSSFWGRIKFFPKSSILPVIESELTDCRNKFLEMKVDEPITYTKKRVFLYLIDKSVQVFFDVDFDNYLIRIIKRYLAKAHPSVEYRLVTSETDFGSIPKSDILGGQHVLTHFRLQASAYGDNSDFNCPSVLKSAAENLNPSNFIYLDLMQCLYLLGMRRLESVLRRQYHADASTIPWDDGRIFIVKRGDSFKSRSGSLGLFVLLNKNLYSRWRNFFFVWRARGFGLAVKKTVSFFRGNRGMGSGFGCGEAPDSNEGVVYYVEKNSLLINALNEDMSFSIFYRRLRKLDFVLTDSASLYLCLLCMGVNTRLVDFGNPGKLGLFGDKRFLVPGYSNMLISDLFGVCPLAINDIWYSIQDKDGNGK